MIVGTAGHIDHGKTTLVRALTGVDTDRLKEEKARGITIELGYAYVPLENGDVLGLIDVPGHEKLVHTMAAGACGIDFALLVIAADDGVMPQTREHLAILRLLGVAHGAIALTKCDRVEPQRLTAVREEIAALLAESPLGAAPIFETCAISPGDPGTHGLAAHLREQAMAWRARRDDGLFRLAVDRVFTLTGQGTVATGTAFAGRVQVGDTLAVMRTGEPVRIRSIHAQQRAAESGYVGQRCALNLAGTDKSALGRGDTLADARLRTLSSRLDVELELLSDAALTLIHWMPVHIHLGTLHRVAHVALLDGDKLDAGEAGRVQLVFDEPVFALPGDRFIVRNAQATRTVGGGRVLDPFGPERKRRTPERRAWLDALKRWLDEGRLDALLAAAPLGLPATRLMHLTGYPPDTLPLPEGTYTVAGSAHEDGLYVSTACWDMLRERVHAALRSFHDKLPDEQGPDASRLRRMAVPLAGDALWRALLGAMLDAGEIARNGPWLHLADHAVQFDQTDEAQARLLLPLIAAGRYDPPWVRDMAAVTGLAEERVRALSRKLARRGELHQVVRDLFYARVVVEELAELIASLCEQHGGILETTTFRDAAGLGRKRAIQLLEFFDRLGYTRFHRDVRRLRTEGKWFGAA
jgi:selenocysteine-specific elongation factor